MRIDINETDPYPAVTAHLLRQMRLPRAHWEDAVSSAWLDILERGLMPSRSIWRVAVRRSARSIQRQENRNGHAA